MIKRILTKINSKIPKSYTDFENKRNYYKLENLHNKYIGQRCFLMGNGPSLNQMDLSVFENDIVFASNRCYLLYDQIDWRPKFYASVDTRVVPDIAYEINDLIQKEKSTTYFFSNWHKQYIKNKNQRKTPTALPVKEKIP